MIHYTCSFINWASGRISLCAVVYWHLVASDRITLKSNRLLPPFAKCRPSVTSPSSRRCVYISFHTNWDKCDFFHSSVSIFCTTFVLYCNFSTLCPPPFFFVLLIFFCQTLWHRRHLEHFKTTTCVSTYWPTGPEETHWWGNKSAKPGRKKKPGCLQ